MARAYNIKEMKALNISVGSESSEDEFKAVKDVFASYKHPYQVDKNYMRKSYDQLPMVVMVLAQNIAGNVIWDLIKFSYQKLLSDKRLQKRSPTIVVMRKGYNAVITKDGFHVRSYEENLTFDKIEDLVKYDQRHDKG